MKVIFLFVFLFCFLKSYEQTIPILSTQQVGNVTSRSNVYIDYYNSQIFKPKVYKPNNTRKVIMFNNGSMATLFVSNSPLQIICIDVDNKVDTISNPTYNGISYTSQMGVLSGSLMGTDNKLYFLSGDFAGSLCSYDFFTKEFKVIEELYYVGGRRIAPYSMYLGIDNKIYVGTFPDTYLFCYDPLTTQRCYFGYQLLTQQTVGQNWVYYIADDSTHVFPSCGQYNWDLFSIHKDSPYIKKLLLHTSGDQRIVPYLGKDTVAYAMVSSNTGDKYYKLINDSAYLLTVAGPHALNRNNPNFLIDNDINYPKVAWNEFDDIFSYQLLSTDTAKSINIPLSHQSVSVSNILNFNDSIMFNGGGQADIASQYRTRDSSFTRLGRAPYNLYGTTINADKIYMGVYSSGVIYEYDPSKQWTLGVNFSQSVSDTSVLSNPRRKYNMYNKIIGNKRFEGIQSPFMVAKTASGYLVSGGNIDRNGEGICIMSFKDTLAGYEGFTNRKAINMCLSNSKETSYFSTYSHGIDADTAKIFEYDPRVNNIIDSFFINPTRDSLHFLVTEHNTFIGIQFHPSDNSHYIFEYNINSRTILWQKKLLNVLEYDNLQYGSDGYVWFTSYSSSRDYMKFHRLNPYTRVLEDMFLINETIGSMVITQNDVYISGDLKFRKLKNVILPLPKGISYQERKRILLDPFFNKKRGL